MYRYYYYMPNQTINIWWNHTQKKIYTQKIQMICSPNEDYANHGDHWVLRHNYKCTRSSRLQSRIEFQKKKKKHWKKNSSTTARATNYSSEFAVRNSTWAVMKRDERLTLWNGGKSDVATAIKKRILSNEEWRRRRKKNNINSSNNDHNICDRSKITYTIATAIKETNKR